MGAALATADDFLVFLRRSRQVAEAPGLVDVPGGHPEPQALCPGDSPQHQDLAGELVVRELFSSVLQEICDEVNLPLLTLSQPLLLGIARNETSAGRASAEFYVQCSLTSEQVRKHYLSGDPRPTSLQESSLWRHRTCGDCRRRRCGLNSAPRPKAPSSSTTGFREVPLEQP